MLPFKKSALAVACAQLVLTNASQVAAQADDNTSRATGEVEHVLVTMPLHKGVAETALPFTVLTGEELRRNASATIGESLANLPGMTSASFGPGVGQPVIRGQQGPRVRVLQNGTSSADAARASQDHANAVEALLADSVEILRGPATLLYGGGAIGGVVNVLDNRIPTSLSEAPTGGVEYRHDTASSMDVVVGRFDTSSGPFALHVDAMYRDFDDLEIPGYAELEGLDDHDDHDDDHDDDHGDEHDDEHEEGERGRIGNTAGRASSFTIGGSYHFDSGFFGLAVNRLENEYGLPEGSHEHDHDDEDHDEDHDDDHDDDHDEEHGEEEGGIVLDMEQTRYDMALHLHDVLPGIEIARTFVTYTDYEHAEIEGNGEVGTLYSNENLEARLELVHKNIAGFDGVIGFQASGGEFSAIGEEAFIPVTDQREWGVFIVEDYHLDRMVFEVGARFDSAERDPQGFSGDQRFTAFSASASLLWQLSDDWTLGTAVARAERAPTLEELYSNLGNAFDDLVIHAATSAYELGNPDLDTEVSNNIDLSLRWNNGSHNASLQLYYNDFTDFINLVNTGVEIDEDPLREFQQDDAEFYGLEFDSRWTLGEFASGMLTADVFGDITYGELGNGDDVPRLPPRRIGAKLAWDTDSWSLWMRVLDAADQDRAGMNETETPGFTRWDAGAEYLARWGDQSVKLFLNVNNLTDEEIRLSTSFLRNIAPEAGLGVEAGFRLQF
ncbi:MAG: TonB-dependent receptor [Congregibacter sp.]